MNPESDKTSLSLDADDLARDRTALANERTLLAYVRTALGFVVLGVPLLVMFPSGAIWSVGLFALVLGAGLVVLGLLRFFRMRIRLQRAKIGKLTDF